MPKKAGTERLKYGAGKYAALHLLIGRWLRHYVTPNSPRNYVTLGGTELSDVSSMNFIDPVLAQAAVSFETEAARFATARATAATLSSDGIKIQVENADLFGGFDRASGATPYLMFVDLEGVCAFSDYDKRFLSLF